MSDYSDLLSPFTADVARGTLDAEERVLGEVKQAHGRWPEWVWTTTEPTASGVTVTACAGDALPEGVRVARRSGVLNAREISE